MEKIYAEVIIPHNVAERILEEEKSGVPKEEIIELAKAFIKGAFKDERVQTTTDHEEIKTDRDDK